MGNHSAASPHCGLHWTGGDTAAVTVYFVPGATQEKDSFALVFEPFIDDQSSANGRSLWRDYMIPPVTVSIRFAYAGALAHLSLLYTI